MAKTQVNFAIKSTDSISPSGDNPGQQTGGNPSSSNSGSNAGNQQTSNVPNAGGDNTFQQASADVTADKAATQKTSSTDEPNAKLIAMQSANTGLLTNESGSFASITSIGQEPIVFGTLLFVGIIILVAVVAKIKNRKKLSFKKSMLENRRMTTALGLFSLLLIFAGAGGAVTKFIGSSASTTALSNITTVGTVDASYKSELSTDDYNVYCATDYITPNGVSEYGYQLFMYLNDEGTLPAVGSGNPIVSTEDWADLNVGEWGYFLGNQNSKTYNPMPLGFSVLDNKNGATTADRIPVTFCAKVDKNTEANYSAEINYIILPKYSTSDEIEIDYNSVDDDDGDGIINREENRLGLDPASADTDKDGLTDDEELYINGTDPLSRDTDGDGLTDYSEVALGAENGTDINANESHTYTETISDELSFTVTGTGNIPLTYIDVVEPSEIAEAMSVSDAENVSEEEKARAEEQKNQISELPGKAYIFRSAGEVTDASITVDTFVAETTGNESADDLDEEVGGIAVTENNELYSMTITLNEDSTLSSTGITDINDNNGKITLPVSNEFSIIFAGDKKQADDELEEEVGGLYGVSPSLVLGGLAVLIKLADVDWSSVFSEVATTLRGLFSGTSKKDKTYTEADKERIKDATIDLGIDLINIWGGAYLDFRHACREVGRENGKNYQTCGELFADAFMQLIAEILGVSMTTAEEQSIAAQIDAGTVSTQSLASSVTSKSTSALSATTTLNGKKNKSTTTYQTVDRKDGVAAKKIKNSSIFKSIKSLTGVGPTAFISNIKTKIRTSGVAFVTLKNNSKSGFGITSISSSKKTALGTTVYTFKGYDTSDKNKSKTWTVTCGKTYCKNGLSDLMLMTSN